MNSARRRSPPRLGGLVRCGDCCQRVATYNEVVRGAAMSRVRWDVVVERAALLASRSFEATTVWIADRGGVAEAMVSGTPRRGLHGPRLGLSGGTEPRTRCGSCCRPARWPEPSATREATDPDPVPG